LREPRDLGKSSWCAQSFSLVALHRILIHGVLFVLCMDALNLSLNVITSEALKDAVRNLQQEKLSEDASAHHHCIMSGITRISPIFLILLVIFGISTSPLRNNGRPVQVYLQIS
jgi:hypothetical protein